MIDDIARLTEPAPDNRQIRHLFALACTIGAASLAAFTIAVLCAAAGQ